LTVFAVVIVLLFGVTQQVMLVRTYRKEARRDVSEKGAVIRQLVVETPPKEFGGNFEMVVKAFEANGERVLRILDAAEGKETEKENTQNEAD
jgi:hypothetical protein